MKALGYILAPVAAIAFALPAATAAQAAPGGAKGYYAKIATYTPRINQRIKNQQRRIKRGIVTGDLRKGEAHRLINRLGDIKAAKRRAKRDGVVTYRERVRLSTMLNKNSKRIRKLRNNRKVAF